MKKPEPTGTSLRRGFTLVELTVGLALTAMMIFAVVMTANASTNAFRETRAQQDLDTAASRALDRIAGVFADAERDGLDPKPFAPFGAESVRYRRCLGWDGADVIWGPLAQFGFEFEAGEVEDGIDNNGNGLVDEGVVVLTENPGAGNQRKIVICHRVSAFWPGEIDNGGDDNGNGLLDERGLSFELVGDVLTVRLCLQGLDFEGRLLQTTAETSVRIRN